MNGIFSIALDASVRAILAACCVAAILAAVRVRSATARHAAWTAVMAAMLLMPVVPDFTVGRRCGPAVSTAARASAGTALLVLALDDSRFLPDRRRNSAGASRNRLVVFLLVELSGGSQRSTSCQGNHSSSGTRMSPTRVQRIHQASGRQTS
jgi:hypothetical protein